MSAQFHITLNNLHRDWIDPQAHRIVSTLQKLGHETYLVGGCVRDLLIGIKPKDFDIATNALPQQVKRKISNSYIIGKRFRLVLAKRGDQQFEIATFRRNFRPEDLDPAAPPITGDNYFGTSQEDAQRRDFTINALFYDPIKNEIIDFCNGLKDVRGAYVRMIGEPLDRLSEDPIRILRALRFAHKLDFTLDPQLRQAIEASVDKLTLSVLPRRREEYIKIQKLKEPCRAWVEAYDLGVLKYTIPELHELFMDTNKQTKFCFHLAEACKSTLDFNDPGEALTALVYAYMKAQYGDEQELTQHLESNPQLMDFMKKSLGMFNLEVVFFEQAIAMFPKLKDIKTFLKRGKRRQAGFVKQEAFLLALKLAVLEQELPFHHLYFWLNLLKECSNIEPELEE